MKKNKETTEEAETTNKRTEGIPQTKQKTKKEKKRKLKNQRYPK